MSTGPNTVKELETRIRVLEAKIMFARRPGKSAIPYLERIRELEAERDELQARIDGMYRLLVWAEALGRSMSGWPETHPNEFTDWKEDWRQMRERLKSDAPGREAE
jgi:hypothetical protein